ncbi:glycine betaine ABC transporter substrate-binding protein [Candidatus Bipolaricaulota bacterium]|nr:glycine betaine ABC transporter substrate-binding protein [Candidatus Bipolaricaulota bacterium]
MKTKSVALVLTLALALTFGFVATPVRAQDETLEIGAIAWEESLAIADLIQHVVRTELDYNVEVTNPNAGVAYEAVSNGDLDLFLESWQPMTQANYLEKYNVVEFTNFGPMYEEAKLTWAVPAYVPEDKLSSVEDLAKEEVKEKLDGEITGIDPGAGIMNISDEMMDEYEALSDYELLEGSGAAMQASLKDAVMNDEWIVVTGWQPHSMYGRFDLRNLEEPKNMLGAEERIHMLGRTNFVADFPSKVSQFLSRLYLPISMVNNLTSMYGDMGEGTGAAWAEEHPEIVDYWVNGVDALE